MTPSVTLSKRRGIVMTQSELLHQPITLTDRDAEQLLCDLVAIPSPSYDEADAARYLVGWFDALGFDQAFVDEAGNAVGIRGNGVRDVILLGHIDTFGASFPVRCDERRLYGRGAVDAKGALCTFAAAAAQAQISPDVRLIVVGAVEEECPTSAGARHIAANYQPAACIIGEPSQWDRITLGYKGRLLIEWEWRGSLGHSAGQAATPAERAFAAWTRVRDFTERINAERDRVFARLDAALQDVQTGHDGVYGWARAIFGFRLPPAMNPATLAGNLMTLLDTADVRAYGMEHAFTAARDSVVSRALRGAIRAEGGQPAFVHKTGTSDMNIVGRIWDCPIAAYGPGDSALDHTADEHIDLDEYLRAIRVLKAALERL